MAGIRVYLEEGFEHDRVMLTAGGAELEVLDVTTRQQIGLATSVDLAVPAGTPLPVTISVPARGLVVETVVDPRVTPHLRVRVVNGSLLVRPEGDPPAFA
jgi:hypothetical protein